MDRYMSRQSVLKKSPPHHFSKYHE